MGKIQNISIVFSNNRANFHPGDAVSGFVKLTVSRCVTISVIKMIVGGLCKTKWTVGSGDDKKIYKGKEQYCNFQCILWGGDASNQTTQLQPGNHQKQFFFTLPQSCPSSFFGRYGGVFYDATVICKFSALFSSDESITKPIHVYDSVNLSADSRLSMLFYQPLQMNGMAQDDCCCCNQVIVKSLLTADKSAYAPGDKIMLNGYIENGWYVHKDLKTSKGYFDSNDAVPFSIILTQHVRYFGTRSDFSLTSSGNLKHKDKDRAIVEWVGPVIAARSRKDFQNHESISLPMVVASGLRNCRLISVTYSLQITVNMPGFCGAICKLDAVPIVVGSRGVTGSSTAEPSAPPAEPLSNSLPAYTDVTASAPPLSTMEVTLPDESTLPPSYASVMASQPVTNQPVSNFVNDDASGTSYYDWNQSAFTYN